MCHQHAAQALGGHAAGLQAAVHFDPGKASVNDQSIFPGIEDGAVAAAAAA
jgi:hypothetical protein